MPVPAAARAIGAALGNCWARRGQPRARGPRVRVAPRPGARRGRLPMRSHQRVRERRQRRLAHLRRPATARRALYRRPIRPPLGRAGRRLRPRGHVIRRHQRRDPVGGARHRARRRPGARVRGTDCAQLRLRLGPVGPRRAPRHLAPGRPDAVAVRPDPDGEVSAPAATDSPGLPDSRDHCDWQYSASRPGCLARALAATATGSTLRRASARLPRSPPGVTRYRADTASAHALHPPPR